MQLDELLQELGKYSGITSDSRQVKGGYIFVAVKGINHDGHDFIEGAISRGASIVVGEYDIIPDATYIRVPDSREALGVLASNFYHNPSAKMKVIGVTGTDGKTTTASLIYWMLKCAGKKVGLVSTIDAKVGRKVLDTGFHVTNPDTVNLQRILSQMVDAECEYAVLEITSHGLDQKRTAGIKFDIGVLTNITHEHLDYHKSFDAYILAKSKLFLDVRVAILNLRDASYNKIKPLINKNVRIVNYPVSLSKRLTEAIENRFPEDYNHLNAQAAISVAKECGVKEAEIVKAVKTLPQLPGRMQEIKTNRGFRVFIDFAHTPNGLEMSLGALVRISHGARLIAIFGCAGERDKQKRPMMGDISARLANISVFTAEDPRGESVRKIINEMASGAISRGAKEGTDIYKIEERGEAIFYAINKLARKGDIVAILGKGHEKSMAYGSKEYPWSDQEAVADALKGKVKTVERGFDFESLKLVHFTGIKGVGMTSLALCFDDEGTKVTGSDTKEVFVTDEILAKRKIKWKVGFSGKNIDKECNLLITTGAHGGLNNPEVLAAGRRGIPVMTHAEALAMLSQGKDTICVCGVGGKSTTSSLIAHLLESANLAPSFAIGVGNIFPLNTPGKFNKEGKYFVCEGDEFAISPGVNDNPRFSLLSPKVLVVTNIEHDHPDIYPTIADTKRAFKEFFQKVPSDGWLVANVDNKNIRDLISDIDVPKATFGFSPDADWRITDVTFSPSSTKFSLKHKTDIVKNIRINIPGQYNVLNATATFIVAKLFGISPNVAKEGLAAFVGVKRRFEFVGEVGGAKIYDDYAHHPLEIRAVLAATRQWFPERRIVAVFQPHTYTRTKVLFAEFATSFDDADVVAFMDIYSSAREEKDPTVNSLNLAKETRRHNKEAYYIGGHEEAANWLEKNLRRGDLLLTLGAGDIFYLHEALIK